MIRIQASPVDSDKLFRLNGLDYQKGSYDVFFGNVQQASADDVTVDAAALEVGVRRNGQDMETLVVPTAVSSWFNVDDDTAYDDYEILMGDLVILLGLGKPSGGDTPGGDGVPYTGADRAVDLNNQELYAGYVSAPVIQTDQLSSLNHNVDGPNGYTGVNLNGMDGEEKVILRVASADVVEVTPAGVTVNGDLTVTGTITPSGGGGLGYLSYQASLSQSGTNDPVAVVFSNDTGQTITWTRAAAGSYNATWSGAGFDLAKTMIIIGGGKASSATNLLCGMDNSDPNLLIFQSISQETFLGMDGIYNRTLIEIRIYP